MHKMRIFAVAAAFCLSFTALSRAADDIIPDTAPPDFTTHVQPPADAPALAPLRANQSMTVNALMGFVNSQPIFVKEVLDPIDDQLRAAAKQSHNLSEFRALTHDVIQQQISTYVDQVLLLSAAQDSMSQDLKEKLDIYLNAERSKILAKYGGSQALADQDLKTTGSSVDDEMRRKKRAVIVSIFLEKVLYPKIVITRGMVLDYYNRHPEEFSHDAEIDLYTITLPISRWLREPDKDGQKGAPIANPTSEQIKTAENLAMGRANDIVAEINKGADFALLAESNSVDNQALKNGGRWPRFKRGTLASEEIENYAFSLPPNSVGKPLLVENPNFNRTTVTIVKIGEKHDAAKEPFSIAQEAIKNKLWTNQLVKLREDYLVKLQTEAAVEAVGRMTDIVQDIAVTRYATN